jgi:hypothetical protein
MLPICDFIISYGLRLSRARPATIVTSKLDFPESDQAFTANRLLASASLYRPRHNACCLVLDGQSHRTPPANPHARPC